MRRRLTVLVIVVALITSAAAQMPHRLKGSSGVWLFTSTAPGMLPAAVLMPVKFSQRQQVSAVGNSWTWALSLQAVPSAGHAMLQPALALFEEGKKDEAAQAVTVALGPDVPAATRCAA